MNASNVAVAKTETTKPSAVLNGVDTAKLAETAGALTGDPSLAPIGFTAKTTWRGGFRSQTETSEYRLAGKTIPHRHRIEVDEPAEMLGTNEAPNPQDLLLAALNACMMVGFVAGATQEGIRLDALEIESSCDFDLRGAFGLDPNIPPGARTIRYSVRVKSSATAAQLEELHARVRATSPNFHHLSTPVVLEGALVTR